MRFLARDPSPDSARAMRSSTSNDCVDRPRSDAGDYNAQHLAAGAGELAARNRAAASRLADRLSGDPACSSDHLGSYLNFCPPMLASYIRPPFATVKVAMPLWYAPAVVAAFFVALAPAEAPVELAFALALAVMAVACASAPNSKLPLVNSLNARWSSKKMISLYTCPPSCNPTVSCASEVFPTYFPFS